MFTSTRNKGFQMTFENGWTISVQYGHGNYCENSRHPDGWDFSTKYELVKSGDAEIAIWDNKGEWYNFGTDTVKGWCSSDEVAGWIRQVSRAKDRLTRPRFKTKKAE